jgi:hypothetical protein
MMKSEMKKRFPLLIAQAAVGIALLAGAVVASAQAPKPFRGTITAISGNTLTVKTDADGVQQVNVPATATLKRVAPGQTDLKSAETIPFSDLAAGDRVLVTPDPNATEATAQALRIIAIKQTDLAQKREKDLQDWQLRGVGGLVKSVDAAAGVIVLSSGSGTTAKTITVHTTKATALKRYAPASARIDAALPAPIDAIHAGDQLQARGTKNADGTEIAAEEVVSGSFRYIAGTIVSLDAASSTVHIAADVQMKRLPDRMAQMLALRLKGNTGAAGAGGNGPAGGQRAGGQGNGGGQWAGQNGRQGGGALDPHQVLNNAPAIQLSDLKKGDAVMLVANDGITEVTAITLLAGVEPLLESPAASQNLLSNWSMSSGSPDIAQ